MEVFLFKFAVSMLFFLHVWYLFSICSALSLTDYNETNRINYAWIGMFRLELTGPSVMEDWQSQNPKKTKQINSSIEKYMPLNAPKRLKINVDINLFVTSSINCYFLFKFASVWIYFCINSNLIFHFYLFTHFLTIIFFIHVVVIFAFFKKKQKSK